MGAVSKNTEKSDVILLANVKSKKYDSKSIMFGTDKWDKQIE